MQIKKDLFRCGSVAMCFLFPLLFLSHTARDLVNFDRISEYLYPTLSFHSEPSNKGAKVVILEVDEKAERAYGWPMARSTYTSIFDGLKSKAGYPLVVSLLHFQEKPNEPEADQALEDAIGRYGKYLSSGMTIDESKKSSLTQDQKDIIANKALLTTDGIASATDFPMLNFDEGTRFLKQAIGVGVAPRFGLESTIYCMQMDYPEAINHKGDSVVSTIALAAAMMNQTNLVGSEGASKVFKSQRPSSFKLATKHCLSNPKIDTEMYMKIRGIERISVADFLAHPNTYSFVGKTVLLASAKMRLYQGPRGPLRNSQAGIVPEHWLTARFLDDMASNTTLRKQPERYEELTRLACQGLLIALTLIGCYAGFGLLLVVTAGATATLLAIGMVTGNVLQELYVPIDGIAAFLCASFFVCLCFVIQRALNATKRVRYIDSVRKSLNITQNMEQLNETAMRLLNEEFSKVTLTCEGENTTLIAMAYNPKEYLAQPSVTAERKHKALPQKLKRGAFLSMKSRRRFPLVGRATTFTLEYPCVDKDGQFGTIALKANALYWERKLALGLLSTVLEEMENNWLRIELQALQKIQDFEVLNLHSRAEILERFLTKNIVNRFHDQNFALNNLKNILTPRECRVAILQADVRGYSTLFKDKQPLQVINWLKTFYEQVIDEASEYAQVKLVGDCIFLFIEEQDPQTFNALIQTYRIACKLIETTVKQNKLAEQNNMPPVNFGIAINYGNVIVGNLSSDHCIDYTIVGSQANKVARLEELTKHAPVKELVKENGIILSEEAALPLQKLLKTPFRQLKLDETGTSVRSFPEIKSIWYACCEDVLNMETKWLKAG